MKLTESQLHKFTNDAVLAHIRNLIEFKGSFTEEDIEPIIRDRAAVYGIDLEDEDYKKVKTDVEYHFKIKHTAACYIYDQYDEKRDWYTTFEPEDEFFWNRYRNHLINYERLDINSVNKLESETLANLMNCLGNPNDVIKGKRLRRGLVIGDVQSGKTATYAGLICKAADAGYKVVILLTGITESLRKQTQERMEEGIIGFTIRVDENGRMQKKLERVGVGLDNKEIKATAFTSYQDDFRGNVDNIVTTLNSHRSLVMFIVKKNVSVLTKLYNWLTEQNKDMLDDLIHEPMLLIDDEADNASINTKKDKLDPTKTNKVIRQLCNAFNNATYVGFTATPFANVFIDPDTNEDMANADLFPEHFIYVLPTPSSYIGATKIFQDDGKYHSWLKLITDINEPDNDEIKVASPSELIEGEFYHKHPKEWSGKLPASLDEAVYSFLLANVIRDLRGDKQQPRTMMVNMSRFTKVQRYIKTYIEQLYKFIFDTVNIDFSNNDAKNKKLQIYQKFAQVWERHYSHLGIPVEKVLQKNVLLESIGKIKVVVVNSSKDSDKLDYKGSTRIIAIGGLALSRGLTLKGLMTSYFYRNTATYDVLLQMGRWFGYRNGYDDLCQIWAARDSVEYYKEISIATEELKEDLKRMFDSKLTPKEFGIRVRDESEKLQITAANKMRNAFSVLELMTYWGGVFETPYASTNINNNQNNIAAVKRLLQTIKDDGLIFSSLRGTSSEGQTKIAKDVPCSTIKALLRKIEITPDNRKFNPREIVKFIEDEFCDKLELWDVALHSGMGDVIYQITDDIAIRTAKRDIYISGEHLCFTGRGVLGGNYDGQIGLDDATISIVKQRFYDTVKDTCRALPNIAWYKFTENRKPLLIIYFIRPDTESKYPSEEKLERYKTLLGDDPIIGFAVGFPANGVRESRSIKYKGNKTYQRQLFEDIIEEDEDL